MVAVQPSVSSIGVMDHMRFLYAFPLLVFVLIAYNIVFYTGAFSLEDVIFQGEMTSGAQLSMNMAEGLVLLALLVLFLEVLKSAGASNATIMEHFLSTALFIVVLIEFLLVPLAGNWSFLMLVVICFIDVVAGYTITIRSARRDLSMG
jgi:hypothetical protein